MMSNDTTRAGSDQPLVTPCKTQSKTFEIYPRTIKVKRPFNQEKTPPPPRNLTTIIGFSDSSRRNLRFKAVNASHILKSQLGLSYGKHWPTDGREFKRHLNVFLTCLRQTTPFLSYLWVAEFQSRGAPHVHLFLNITPTPAERHRLATLWCNIVNAPDKASMLAVHDHPRNFIQWKMGNGSYLVKYLDKAAQKTIPEDFHNFGRFWGNSQKLVGDPEIITADDLAEQFPETDIDTGEMHDQDAVKFLLRTVGRYHEKHHRNSWFRHTNKSTSAITGAPIFRQALAYLHRTRGHDLNPSPF